MSPVCLANKNLQTSSGKYLQKSGLTVSHDIDLAYEVLLNHAENKDISEAEPSWLSIGAANQDGQVFHAKNGCIYRIMEIDYSFIDTLEISNAPCICRHELVAITQCGKAVFKQPHLGEDLPSAEQAIQYFKSIDFEYGEPNLQGDGILFPECQIKTKRGQVLIFDLQLKDARLQGDNSVQFLISYIPATPSSNPIKYPQSTSMLTLKELHESYNNTHPKYTNPLDYHNMKDKELSMLKYKTYFVLTLNAWKDRSSFIENASSPSPS